MSLDVMLSLMRYPGIKSLSKSLEKGRYPQIQLRTNIFNEEDNFLEYGIFPLTHYPEIPSILIISKRIITISEELYTEKSQEDVRFLLNTYAAYQGNTTESDRSFLNQVYEPLGKYSRSKKAKIKFKNHNTRDMSHYKFDYMHESEYATR